MPRNSILGPGSQWPQICEGSLSTVSRPPSACFGYYEQYNCTVTVVWGADYKSVQDVLQTTMYLLEFAA